VPTGERSRPVLRRVAPEVGEDADLVATVVEEAEEPGHL
jgi:hypothetical protein